jgi:hypothetical protein
MLIVQYTTFRMDRFHISMPVRLWHGSKKPKGFNLPLLGYLINTLGRMVSLYNYQGRNAEGLKSSRNYLTQLMK